MRIFAISDLHVDYPDNHAWLQDLSRVDHCDDTLIVAGDVSADIDRVLTTLEQLQSRFLRVCFVAGNHDLWVRDSGFSCSLDKFNVLMARCRKNGVVVDTCRDDGVSLVPLQGWYDYSFAEPTRYLQRAWRDYRACSWPDELASSAKINQYFLAMNQDQLQETNQVVISYSHFVPHIELLPERIPPQRRKVYPVLGSRALGQQVQQLQPNVHVYGHSHINVVKQMDEIVYVNNAFGYPSEAHIAGKALQCIYPETPRPHQRQTSLRQGGD